MSQFRTITEAVLRNCAGELDRIELRDGGGYLCLPHEWLGLELAPGDTITIEQRETEVV